MLLLFGDKGLGSGRLGSILVFRVKGLGSGRLGSILFRV